MHAQYMKSFYVFVYINTFHSKQHFLINCRNARYKFGDISIAKKKCVMLIYSCSPSNADVAAVRVHVLANGNCLLLLTMKSSLRFVFSNLKLCGWQFYVYLRHIQVVKFSVQLFLTCQLLNYRGKNSSDVCEGISQQNPRSPSFSSFNSFQCSLLPSHHGSHQETSSAFHISQFVVLQLNVSLLPTVTRGYRQVQKTNLVVNTVKIVYYIIANDM